MVRAYTTGLLTVLSLLVARAGAQTTMPVGADGSSILAIPAGWVKTSDIATSQGFRPGIAGQIVASFHPENARPTDIPYAILEHIDPEPNPGNASVWYAAPHVQAKYAQAIDPPSRADLAGTWKSSQVTKPVFGPNGFTFRATVNYVGGVSGNHTYYVNVLGHYEAEGTTVLSVWADQNARSAYSASIDELSTAGLRPPPKLLGPPPVSFQERLVSWAKISGVMLILFVVGVQVWVIVPRAKTAAGGRGGVAGTAGVNPIIGTFGARRSHAESRGVTTIGNAATLAGRMPKLTIDGREIEFQGNKMLIQAVHDAGVELPHYCYHPGLSSPASCRICLVEVEGIPKLVPACYTPAKDGMVVHLNNSTKAVANQKQVMEFLLINHPLDCPVCDKAGECGLQDYSYEYGRSQSRFEEDKSKNPKKDVGEHVLLYSDRCIMCTRCVRFTREVAGTAELMVDGRGHKEEIDIFPGKPLNNRLSLNVVDLCPVGALLDKNFLFKQRVWRLTRTPSISPVDAGGENIYLEHNEGNVYRIKPRFNEAVNKHWISNDTRLSFQAITANSRLVVAKTKHFGALAETSYKDAVADADRGLRAIHAKFGAGSLYAVLSPMMACEEAWLLGTYLRSIDPDALLVLGPVPATKDEAFKHYMTGKESFRIAGEKVPNRRGIERVIAMLGGPHATWDQFTAANAHTNARGGWIVGGFLSTWITDVPEGDASSDSFLVVQDVLPNALTSRCDVLLPAAMWAEKDGTWENAAGKLQAFDKAVEPPGAARREGDVYLKLLGRTPEYVAAEIRAEMGPDFANVMVPVVVAEEPAMEFAEL